MKQFIRRLSRVADSSHYSLLQSDSTRSRRSSSFRTSTAKLRRSNGLPAGHLPVYVGDEMERFVVSAEYLNHPIFVELLNKSAQEYGFEQKGVLRIPCHVVTFERVLEAVRVGGDIGEFVDLRDLLN
uniref:PlSAUR2 protein n=1 Tax=Paeonia lactiflora TaxID=35924 RepID=A0AA49K7I2_PAELC|nr:PlSAUR2 protein [Paeonia lactiflora]